MTRDEFKQIVIALEEAYQGKFKITQDGFRIWYEALKDISFTDMKAATIKLMTESEYPPTIAALRKCAVQIARPLTMKSTDEAWGEVRSAIRKYGWYREAEALDSLSPEVRKLVARFGFKQLCMSDNIMADRAHFIKLYNAQMEKAKADRLMPPSVKAQIEHNKQNQPQLESGRNNASR